MAALEAPLARLEFLHGEVRKVASQDLQCAPAAKKLAEVLAWAKAPYEPETDNEEDSQ